MTTEGGRVGDVDGEEQKEPSGRMEHNHFSHDHPLVLSEEKKNHDFPCAGCGEPIFGLAYCCRTCPYVLHKWCSELPRELPPSKSHPDHPLVLLARAPPEPSGPSDCKTCGHEIKVPSFRYACNAKGCSFGLHVECASFPDPLSLEVHDRGYKADFTLDRSWTPPIPGFPCFLCNRTSYGPMFIYSETDSIRYYLHVQCAMLPRTVKHSVHRHDLVLRPPLKENDWYFEFYCDACETERDPRDYVYYCEPCELVAHIGCGVSGSDRPIQNILGTCPTYKSSKSTKEARGARGEVEDEVLVAVIVEEEAAYPVKYFSHEHPLNVADCRKNTTHCCRICSRLVFGMIYFCTDCHFYLHKWCAQLPRELHYSMHRDHGPLKLLLRDDHFDEILSSEGIDLYPLTPYTCEKCDFEVDPVHAMLPSDLNHPSHQHALNAVIIMTNTYSAIYDWNNPRAEELKLPLRWKQGPPCRACGFLCEGISLECETCNFYLHVFCSLLPPTGKHESHRHSLKLSYSYEEDPDALEFICDACEKPRTPNRWVYCCPDPKCYVLAHIDCAVPNLFATFEHQC